MADQNQSTQRAGFFEHLKRALESVDKPDWLGQQSPLAAPYFLGDALRGAEPTPSGRGKALCAEMERTLESMWGSALPDDGDVMLRAIFEEGTQGDRYDCLILELNYFKRRFRPAPRSQSEIYNDILHISRPTHDRHLRAAVDRLGTLLLQRLRPAVRPEQPILPPTLVGRDRLQREVLAALESGTTVSLTGAGGMGKTALGAALAEHWASPAIFWYTFRPTFNDQLESLLFALGHFLHTQGASTLWHQLVADAGRIKDRHIARGLALTDLEALRYRPLLCFDELDFLRPLSQDQAKPDHVQILEFLDSLRGQCAILLIGQRAFWESDASYSVDGLTPTHLGALLTDLAVAHTPNDVAALYTYTAGNPRMVELCIALQRTSADKPLITILEELPQSHALLPLWHRLERQLPAAERRLVQALAVFRSPAPADVWTNGAEEAADALAQLVARRLVQQDGRGGVALLLALRELIYAELPVETRESCHLQAAHIRAERGEYTAGAHHLQQAGQPAAAVALWYPVRTAEINRGQAGAALATFAEISHRRLTGARRKELLLLRSELHQLTGEPDKVIENLAQEEWSPNEETSVDAALLWAKALDVQGRSDGAMAQQTTGIAAATRLLDKLTRLYIQRSLSHLHERSLALAWHDVNLASHHVETMKGALHEQAGDLTAARAHYLGALTLAEALTFPSGMARVHHHLGNIAIRQMDITEAVEQYQAAMDIYEHIGDLVGREVVRSGMATAYMQMGDYAAALPPAQQALRFFVRMNDSFWTAVNASNLAEAAFELGDLTGAEEYAERVLAQEEPHSHPYALFTLGRTRLAQQRVEHAEHYLTQARKVAEQNDDSYLLAYVWEELSRVFAGQADYARAKDAAMRASKLFQTLGISAKVAEIAEVLYNLDALPADPDASTGHRSA